MIDPSTRTPAPGILIAHAWMGQDDFARKKAHDLARLGYVAFAADVYGDGQEVQTNDEAAELMMPLFMHRDRLRARIRAAYDTLASDERVDSNKIGAIGFCFGGLTVVELLRQGAPLRGVVSFHGVLTNQMGTNKAHVEKNADLMSGSLLILHGHDDPMMSQKDLLDLQKEFTDAGIDWQMKIYGQTMHAFTNPLANQPDSGLMYNRTSDYRSWQEMRNFFNDVFV